MFFLHKIAFLFLTIQVVKPIHHDEICGGFDGRRLYLELGEHGTLFSSHHNSTQDRNGFEHGQCTLEIVTCPSCVIAVHFSYLNLSNTCGNVVGECPCSYISIFEPPYEQVSEKRYCGYFLDMNNSSLYYKSITRTATIRFFYNTAYNQAFVLNYFSERNRRFINGNPESNNGRNFSNEITSPYFPNNYPRDLSVEYIINCKVVKICRIKLSFADFQISRSSLIEFFDWNGQRMFVTTGSIFRPPILISTGPTIVVRFYANGGTNVGYKFIYTFLNGESNGTLATNTNCGGLVDNLGGGITMNDMVETGIKKFDCIWILKPPQGYLHQKTHLFIKITNFEYFDNNTKLIIKEGLNSNGPSITNILTQTPYRSREHVVPSNQGFYISLQGDFNQRTKLEIVYAAFSYRDCSLGTDFLCQNQRCISPNLECDGFNQCGDNSDEPEICSRNKIARMYTPNFYFPKGERDIDLKTATIIFVISSFALICLVVSLIVLVYRINVKGTRRNHLQAHLQSINELLDETLSRTEEEEIIIPDDPPCYEAPPTYADVIKVFAESDRNTIAVLKIPKHRHCGKHTKKHVDVETSSVSTVDSTANLIGNPIQISSLECSIPQMILETKGMEQFQPGTSQSGNDTPLDNKEPNRLSKWLKRETDFSFASNEGFFSTILASRNHCLSDSDLTSVKGFVEENSTANVFKITRSLSIENLCKL
ncbi:uncharacterized protein [Onthophagus taurus]|uniref:uncharacterized protein isoform X1 n=1 Tax=Onthophagus taurus TaxID=166361 RepID=UPI0039BE27D1